MTRTARKLLLINGALGMSLTLLVVCLDQFGQLQALERWFYDRRARDCQFFVKPPTDKLVYLDIDDYSLDIIERWPWKRSTMATIIDEVAAANPKLIFLDILYTEPQEVGYAPQPDNTYIPTDHDAIFAQSLHRAANAIVPVSLSLSSGQQRTPLETALYEILTADLELTPAEATEALKKKQSGPIPTGPQFVDLFLPARRAAMLDRIKAACVKEELSPAELRAQLLPRTDDRLVQSPLIRLLIDQYEKYQKLKALERFSLPAKPGMPPLMTAIDESAPLAAFSQEAGGSGYVDYFGDGDGVVRRIPLLAMHRGRMLPQMGLLVAAKLLDADLAALQVTANALTLPRPDGRQIRIPITTSPSTVTGLPIGTIMQIPYFGGPEWETMYDAARKQRKAHVPINAVWQVIETRRAIESNNGTADQAIINSTLLLKGEARAKQLAGFRPRIDDAEARAAEMRDLLKLLEDEIAKLKGELTTEQKERLDNLKYERDGMRALLAENNRLSAQLLRQRGELSKAFAGRGVLIGSIANGIVHDRKPTSLHRDCPGVVIHGVVASGILTGEMWRLAPRWITVLLTILTGLTTTFLVIRTSPMQAAIGSLALAITYFLINGILLFDYFNIILGVAAPIVAMLLTWLSCQLVEILVEKAERNRITRRFRAYVDPALVDYVIENPEQNVTSGQEREMTVVFTDLAGFTTISEALKEQVIPLLNDYLGLMSSIITKHHGFVNKFLGDGIMFFYNAPRNNPDHAGDAVATVLEMQEKLIPFNASLTAKGLPAITMRAGIVTGTMVVGDAGGETRSDYTVIGDNVNLAARLESANKATGTKVLMTTRTAELLGDRYLTRPIARLQVKGKTQGVDTCEVIGSTSAATDEQIRMAQLGQAIFEHFTASNFAACNQALDDFEADFGKTKLTKAYRALCEEYLAQPPGTEFDGQIVLEEK